MNDACSAATQMQMKSRDGSGSGAMQMLQIGCRIRMSQKLTASRNRQLLQTAIINKSTT